MLMSKILNDPIHGHIEIPSYCIEVIDTPQFQRLRDLKQLGITQLIYPGACHTRFEHSLGVATLSNQLITQIKTNQPELDISDRDIRCVTLAGLCHDLGHGPFSHLFENWQHSKNIDFNHEIMSNRIFEYLIDDNNLDIDRDDIRFVKDLILGQPTNFKKAIIEDRSWIYDIVANRRNSIDVDKWDYMARDCYYLGIKNTYDFSRLMKYNRVIGNEICFNVKEAYNLYEMFHTRYSLSKQVYSHRVGCAIDCMLRDIMELSDQKLRITEKMQTPEGYCQLSDNILRQIECSNCPELADARKVIYRIRKRKLYKLCYEALVNTDDEIEFKSRQLKIDDLVKSSIILNQRVESNATNSHFSHQSFKYHSNFHQPPYIPSGTEETFHATAPLSAGNFAICTFDCNYAKSNKNPVHYVRFYNSEDPDSSFSVDQNQVSLLIPSKFNERYFRIYCKDTKLLQDSIKAADYALQLSLNEINQQR